MVLETNLEEELDVLVDGRLEDVLEVLLEVKLEVFDVLLHEQLDNDIDVRLEA